MQKDLAEAGVKQEFTLKIKIEPLLSGYTVLIQGADGVERKSNYKHDTVLDALETGAYLLKIEAEKLLKTLQEMNNG